MARRPDGALETEVLRALWAAPATLSVAEVREALPFDLAYTSVATVLVRLHRKGRVERVARGKGFAYRAVVEEADLAVRRIGDVLAASSDRRSVLAGFVGSLSEREAQELRDLLDGRR